MAAPSQVVSHRWRHFATAAGRLPVKEFLRALSDEDAWEVAAAMKDVRNNGLRAARHLRNEIYEVRASGPSDDYRVLFAPDGKKSRILLALEAVAKHGQKTPDRVIDLAERRLRDWRSRASPSARGRAAR